MMWIARLAASRNSSAESWNSPLVELSRLDEFRFGVGVVNQEHPIARRAACMTSS